MFNQRLLDDLLRCVALDAPAETGGGPSKDTVAKYSAVLARMEPEWSFDVASAPRDGNPVLVAYRTSWDERPYQAVCWRGDGDWQGGPAMVPSFTVLAWRRLGAFVPAIPTPEVPA